MRAIYRIQLAIVVVLTGYVGAFAEDSVTWQPNLETAQRLAAQSNRLILIHFGAPWCKPCGRLEQEVLSKPELGTALEPNFVCVKLNVDDAPGTARMYGVSSIPTDVIITPTGKLVSAQPSAPTVNQYITQMTQVADGHKKLQQNAQAAGRAAPAAVPTIQTVANTTPAVNVPVQQGAYSDDRYADYYKNKQPSAPQVSLPPQQAPVAPQQPQSAYDVPGVHHASQAPVVQQGMAAQQAPVAPQVSMPSNLAQPSGAPQQQPVQQYAPYGAQAAAPQQQAAQPQQRAAAPAPQLPAGSPALGLDGNCPVQLSEQKRWVRGDIRYGAVHRGRTYLFTGPEEQKRFLANPDAYSPVISGNDPVMAMDHGQEVAGRREHGVFFNNQIYLFSSETTLQRFNQNPNRYAGPVMQAMRPSQNTAR